MICMELITYQPNDGIFYHYWPITKLKLINRADNMKHLNTHTVSSGMHL